MFRDLLTFKIKDKNKKDQKSSREKRLQEELIQLRERNEKLEETNTNLVKKSQILKRVATKEKKSKRKLQIQVKTIFYHTKCFYLMFDEQLFLNFKEF